MTYNEYCNANYGPEDIDDDYDPEMDCEHEHYEIDVCMGRAECDYCSKSWYLEADEIDAELDRQANYHEEMQRENRRQWWSDLLYNIRHPLQAIHWQLQKRGWLQPRPQPTDDDIPF